jgi:protein PET117
MSRASKLTLMGTSLFALSTVVFVHFQQKWEQEVCTIHNQPRHPGFSLPFIYRKCKRSSSNCSKLTQPNRQCTKASSATWNSSG